MYSPRSFLQLVPTRLISPLSYILPAASSHCGGPSTHVPNLVIIAPILCSQFTVAFRSLSFFLLLSLLVPYLFLLAESYWGGRPTDRKGGAGYSSLTVWLDARTDGGCSWAWRSLLHGLTGGFQGLRAIDHGFLGLFFAGL